MGDLESSKPSSYVQTVYGSDVVIPNETLRYSTDSDVPNECRIFHEKLVMLGNIPDSYRVRYGLDPLATYKDPKTHPAEYIRSINVNRIAELRAAMEWALDVLIADMQLPIIEEEQDRLDAA